MSKLYKLYTFIRLLKNIKIKRKITKTKTKNWETELPIFIKKISKLMEIIKYTNSVNIINKNFINIKKEFTNILSYRPDNIDMEFNGIIINFLEDIIKMDQIKDDYIKNFLLFKIDLELQKEKIVTQKFLKESLIKKALNFSLKAIEYIPQDVEMRLKIIELEDLLMQNYKEGEDV